MSENERIPGLGRQEQNRLDKEFEGKWQKAKANYPPDPDESKAGPDASPTTDRGQSRQLELKQRELSDEVNNWMKQHQEYTPRKLFPDVEIKPDAGAEDLPLEFVDYLIDLADRKWNLFDILRQTASVKIYPYGGTITIGLKDSQGRILAQLHFDTKPPFKFWEVGSTMPK